MPIYGGTSKSNNERNVSWKDNNTQVESLCLAGLLSMADILIEQNLRRLGHVHRMNNNRLPK